MRASLLPLLLLAGCTTTITTRDYDAARDAGGIDGVRYYEPRLYRVRYDYSALIDKSGALLGDAAAGTCRVVAQKEELATLPDFAHPRVLLQHTGAFSSGKIGVTLNNGVLTGLNVESSPQSAELLATLQKAAASVATATLMPERAGGTPACNAGPVIGALRAAELPAP